eukprot:SAG25_NODE_687_length_5922_cov_2.835995_2_plen_238_part_00
MAVGHAAQRLLSLSCRSHGEEEEEERYDESPATSPREVGRRSLSLETETGFALTAARNGTRWVVLKGGDGQFTLDRRATEQLRHDGGAFQRGAQEMKGVASGCCSFVALVFVMLCIIQISGLVLVTLCLRGAKSAEDCRMMRCACVRACVRVLTLPRVPNTLVGWNVRVVVLVLQGAGPRARPHVEVQRARGRLGGAHPAAQVGPLHERRASELHERGASQVVHARVVGHDGWPPSN